MALSFDDLPDEQPVVAAAQTAPVAQGGLSFDDLPDEQPAAAPTVQPQGLDPMELYRGAARSVDNMGLAAGRILGIPAAQTFDAARGMFTDDDPNMAQNALREHVLDPLQRRADSLAPAPDALFGNKLMNAGGGFAGNLAAMLATGGLSRATAALPAAAPTSVLPGVASQLGQAAKTMAVPATTNAINTGHDVTAETGSVPEGLKAAIAAGAGDVAMGLIPANLPGNLATRLATGAPLGVATGEASRQLRNAAVPSSMQTPFNAQDAMVNAAMGSVLGGVLGRAPDPAAMPAQAQQPEAPPVSPQPVPAPVPKTPFAGSQDIAPLLDNLGVQGEQRTQSLDLLRPAEQDIETRRRGVVTMDEQRRLASLIGLDGAQAQAFSRKIGQAWNAEQIIAGTDLVSDRLKTVMEQQQRIASGQATDLEKAAFVQDLGDMKVMFGELMGARAESGRALAAQRRQVQNINDAARILEGIGGVQGADDLAAAIGKAVQAGGVQNLAKLVGQPESKMQRLFGYYFRAALLSGVRTHAVNITSNTATLGNEIIERSIAAGIGSAKRLATGGKSGQTVFAEPLDLLIGMSRGMAKAGTAATDAFRTGESAVLGGQAKQDNSQGLNNTPRRPGVLGGAAFAADRIASLPYRALGAEDAWFGTLNFEAELRTLARREALVEKRQGQLPEGVKFSQRIDQLTQNPTPKMIEAAGLHARTNTFNSKAGAFAQAVMSAKSKAPWLNLIVPFVRTPANVVKFGLHRTPLAPLFKEVREDFAAGGARQERAAARIVWGTGVMVMAGMAAQAGYITGAGPDDKKEKQALLATGWRPYSVKVGDTYHEYNRLDPFAQWLGLAADMTTMDYQHKDAADVAVAALGSLVNNTINKTYMAGLSNFVEFMQDPKRNAEWYSRQMVGTMAQPFTLLSNIASETDPFAREGDSILDSIKYRLPGLRNDLATKLDGYGEPVPNRRYPGGPFSIGAPIAQSQETTDPVRIEASRLGWAPTEFQKSLTLSGKKIEIPAEQHHELAELAGKLTHRAAQKLMRSPGWAKLDDDQKRDALQDAATKARTSVRLASIPFVTRGNRAALDKLRDQMEAQR
ncbi:MULTISPECIES: hypothetical protein [Pseudomonas]|uniref:Large polyvalent protein associated domain-containing protein n=1 Tax=Pseudomonas putida NBRC 14164 TaxID=1211579 RepID=A0ABM7EF11_PSEPU|nr:MULTISPECIES: hypothetical protein [Pseudomonas]MCX9135593.1 hypothetical protein [Pseudomonas sp. DCB_PUT]MDD1969586.1 hypothetical protein [Pseudomonas putida]NWD11295.1 hypothetical protein [Pseudomonas putida]UUI32902.1 hypothetical protein NP430_15235 [Pseudomonas putida]SUD71012.1 Uncharacterised protein [Pseudomonas putida]